MIEDFLFVSAKIYAFAYYFIKKITGYRIRGLGFLLRRIKSPKIIKFNDKKLFINPSVISSYGLNIIGISQEKETQVFLDKIMHGLVKYGKKVDFIDVGSNIGIFLLQMSGYKIINYLIGFEPSIGCVKAASQTLKLNNFSSFKIFNNLVGSQNIDMFYSNDLDPQSASIYKSKNNKNSKLLKQIKLDDNMYIENLSKENLALILIDVEGFEPEVIKGGIKMIQEKKPLLIFEYNKVSKKYFSLDDIHSILGNEWQIYRLRKDSKLDFEFNKTWNCVAINKHSIYSDLLKELNLFKL